MDQVLFERRFLAQDQSNCITWDASPRDIDIYVYITYYIYTHYTRYFKVWGWRIVKSYSFMYHLHVYAYGWFSVRVVVCVFHSEDFCLPDFNATQWAASVHTLHMSKPVITFVFRVLRNGIPARERRLRKESGKMATEIAPKLRF